MNIHRQIERDFNKLVAIQGNTITIYDPTITLDDEGDRTYSLGAGTDVKAILSEINAEDVEALIQGLDIDKTYRCFISSSYSIDKETIILYNSQYYQIYKIEKKPINDSTTFYSLLIQQIDITIS